MNPGGTGKDRAALHMIRTFERLGLLPPPLTDSPPRNGNSASSSVVGTIGDLTLTPSLSSPDDAAAAAAAAAAGRVTSTESTSDDDDSPRRHSQQLDRIVAEAIQRSRSGGLVVEGTSGSTGIALATLCASRGHGCLVVLPDDQAAEKRTILRSLGAVVHVVPTAAISNPNHYVNVARRAAQLARDGFHVRAVFVDQFENAANFGIHHDRTGPELWEQMGGRVDAFVMGSGTGGTIAGIATFLRSVHPEAEVVLVDPPGSALYHRIEHGVAYSVEQQERTVRKHRYDTLAEGIGSDRLTENLSLGLDCIDRAIRVPDQEAVDMAHWILKTEGLWMGSSSAMNLVGAVRTALTLPEDSRVVTVMCDGGQRHATRFWNPNFILERGLKWPEPDDVPGCLRSIILRSSD
jgi:cysteine synthase